MVTDPEPFWHATIAAALLRQGRWLMAFSLGLTLLALGGLLLALAMGRPLWALLLALSLAPGFAALWLGFRAAFDADLFAALAGADDLPRFDRAMISLGLMPAERAGRALDARITGALHLLKMQAAALGLQLLVLILGVLFLFLKMVS